MSRGIVEIEESGGDRGDQSEPSPVRPIHESAQRRSNVKTNEKPTKK